MPTLEMPESTSPLLDALIDNECFHPQEPRTLEDTGLPVAFVESLVCKVLVMTGSMSGRMIAERLALPYRLLERLFETLRTRQVLVYKGSAPLNDYYYALTEQGRSHGQALLRSCGYVGPAPVPLIDYILSVEAQSISAEAVRRQQLIRAFSEISVPSVLFDALGPAVNSGAGMFLYGAPGNGKSTLARRITACFGQQIWLPFALYDDGQVIKLFDPAYHDVADSRHQAPIRQAEHDHRWLRVRRPTVVVGGELTMDNLELRHDPRSSIHEAPLQLKSNGGCLLIDDFGRQRIEPQALLNRWIVPLENRQDFLTLATGKKIQVPFDQLIIFSTNLDPQDLADEAFLRRIPYKIEVQDPDEREFHDLFELYAKQYGCSCRHDAVEHLLDRHYRPHARPLRRCHPRDLLGLVRHFCAYQDRPLDMLPEYFDQVVPSYFTVVGTGRGTFRPTVRPT